MIEVFLSFERFPETGSHTFLEMGRLFNPGIRYYIVTCGELLYVDLSLAVGKYIIGFEKHKTPGTYAQSPHAQKSTAMI